VQAGFIGYEATDTTPTARHREHCQTVFLIAIFLRRNPIGNRRPCRMRKSPHRADAGGQRRF
jgi:hypothetical protein